MRKLIHDLTSDKKNDRSEIIRVILFSHFILMPLVLLWAIGMYTYAFFAGKSFDIQSALAAVMNYSMGAATLMMGGGASIFFKRTTESEVNTIKIGENKGECHGERPV